MNDRGNTQPPEPERPRAWFTAARWIAAGGVAMAGLGLLIFALGAGDKDKKPIAAKPAAASSEKGSPSIYEGNQWEVVRPGEHDQFDQRHSLQVRGKVVYQIYCVGCHGENGDGKGPAAVRLITQPRDFTKGIYKFRTTDSSSLPMESDLHRTISRGLPGVSMPAFPLMPESDKIAVIEYVKSFYPKWDQEAPRRKVVYIPRAPEDMQVKQPAADPELAAAYRERVERGRLVYMDLQCAACHGTDGSGTGATNIAYVDAWGNPQRPKDFTTGSLKGGNDPEDVYRTFHTGLRSIMPSFGRQNFVGVKTAQATTQPSSDDLDAIAEQNSWDLVAYVLSLRKPAHAAQQEPPK